MPRRRKVPIIKGPKRILGSGDSLRIVQTLFCGECDRRLKTAITQKPHTKIARVCDNVEGHKDGKKYLFPLKGYIVPLFENV